jgi:hypothetical protein
MGIFVLIIISLFTLAGLISLKNAIREGENITVVVAFIWVVLGTLSIIFQALIL